MSSATNLVVVDIGSTRLRYGRGTERGPVAVRAEPTRADALTEQLLVAVEDVRARSPGPIQGVSVSTTGLVDAERGVIAEFDANDGTRRYDVRLAEAVEDAFGLPTAVQNDCTAAALGEYRFGEGRGYDSVAHVTFGTGIGAGVVEDGRPIRGERGYAAEVGLFSIRADGELSSTGVRGAWEAYCSGRGIPNFARQLLAEGGEASSLRELDEITAPDVFAAADDGDNVAEMLLDRIARYNAAGVGTLVNAYDPGVVTLGGSVALENAEWMLSGIREHLDDYVLAADPPPVELTTLGEDIELYGATAELLGPRPETSSVGQAGD
ncbi:ROK family protein [Haloprofundus halophilus]|uniref:ROK family protein n=1 Tax=Haloprofundus halophilus TaxID=2283527 RepID=UPI00130018F2|nr:ROK family protein [Haloprofundus halophilus]